MPREAVLQAAFNRGIVSRLSLARTDIKRVALSAEIQTNWMPRVLGSMMLRPGLGYIDSTRANGFAVHLPFIFSLEDTAILELTDAKARVRIDEAVVTRPAVSTAVVNDGFTLADPGFNKLANPATLPAASGSGVAFSADGQLMAVVNSAGTAPTLAIYSISGTTFTKLSDPASLPPGSCSDVAFSPNGQFLAVSSGTSPFVTIYSISGTGAGATFTKLADPATLPAGTALGVAFSPNSDFLAVAHGTTPFVTIYSISGTTFTKLANPASLPAAGGNGVAFNQAGTFLAVAHSTTPFVTIYSISGSTFTKIADPASLPASTGNAVAFSRDGLHMAVGHATTPFVTIYSISGTTFTKLSNPATLPDSAGNSVAFSSDNQFLCVATSTTQFLTLYQYLSGVWTKIADPGTLPAGGADACAFSANNRFLAIAHATTPFITIYEAYTWLDLDQAGATSSYLGSNLLALTGTLYTEAKRVQAVSLLNADKNIEHALNITVSTGPVKFRVGSTFGAEDLIGETMLEEGYHSLAFTPTTNLFFIQVSGATQYTTLVDTITVAGAGDMELVTPFLTADLRNIRWQQSADVIYLACDGYPQYKIQRRGARSWSLVYYRPADGPFRDQNTSFITISTSALTGTANLTASQDIFRPGHQGALFKVRSIGQTVQLSATGANQFSSDIRVTGVGTARSITVVRSGTWSATVTLQRSLTAPGSWTDVATFTTNGTATYTDDLDNQVVYYRIGVKTGDYTSGTAVLTLSYASGGLDGIMRISRYTSGFQVAGQILQPFGALTASENWSEGAWSSYRGFPTAVGLFESRLEWAGKDKVWGSVVDAFESFDPEVEGDSGPFARSIGEGPVDKFAWLLALQRLILGAEMAEFSAKSSNFDEPLTPSNFNLKASSTQGSAPVPAVKIDNTGIFADRSATKLFQLSYNVDTYDYGASDLTLLCPELLEAGVVRIAVQRRPDTRVHVVLADGTAGIMVLEPGEEVTCWVTVETDGLIEDVVILPGAPEDKVYYTVNRTINGVTKRYLEKWALESEGRGAVLTKLADSFKVYQGAATATITGAGHLEGKTVTVWADGIDVGTKVVSGGQFTLDVAASTVVYGLYYEALFKGTKLAYAAGGGTALNRRKRLIALGLTLADTHAQGLEVGDDFTNMVDLPSVEAGQVVDPNSIWSEFEYDLFAINSTWKVDSRLCLRAASPRACTVLGASMVIETNG